MLDLPKRGRWAIEIRHALSGRVGKGFHLAREDLAPSRSFVVHAGEDRHLAAEDVEAVPLVTLMKELRP